MEPNTQKDLLFAYEVGIISIHTIKEFKRPNDLIWFGFMAYQPLLVFLIPNPL